MEGRKQDDREVGLAQDTLDRGLQYLPDAGILLAALVSNEARDVPATGTSVGLERILTAMEELGLLEAPTSSVQVLVAFQDRSLEKEALAVSREIRSSGVRCEVYLKSKGALRDQLAYAGGKGIPWVVILGPEEAAEGKLVLKDMIRREQRQVERSEASAVIAAAVAGL